MGQQDGEQAPLPGRDDSERHAVPEDLQRSQQPELDHVEHRL
jgi:hypothetical protein